MGREDQGISNDRFTVIPRTLVFITQGSQVLLLKGSMNKRLWANQYNGIGGHIERGEDLLSSARRELKEEAGLEGMDLWLCGTALIDAGKPTGICIFMFRGESKGEEITNSDEGELAWIETDKLADYPLVEDLKIILPRLLELKRGDDPLSFRYYYDSQDHLQVRQG